MDYALVWIRFQTAVVCRGALKRSEQRPALTGGGEGVVIGKALFKCQHWLALPSLAREVRL